jgi:hypothetical protein
MPDSFQGVEFGGVSWQVVDLDIFAMMGKPVPDVPVFVVGSIVLDEVDFAGKIAANESLQVEDVGLCI